MPNPASSVELDLRESVRLGLRRLAKAVAIITTSHNGNRYAMAATAVSEVSLEPASLLICVNQAATIHSPLVEGAGFCVNILPSTKQTLAKLCSGSRKGEHRFSEGEWRLTPSQLPYLLDAQAAFACRATENHRYGTHEIFIGDVEHVFLHGQVDPLIYVDSRYGRVIPDG
jgi:flavin reductase (DIM6/NTAB) family NADH-FMN oxidoreductase RutF